MLLVRRKSGGGAVYHVNTIVLTLQPCLTCQVCDGQDLGNSNYCVLSPREGFDRHRSAAMVSRALRKLGIPAYVNARHDICVEQYKISFQFFLACRMSPRPDNRSSCLHVSGSAFKLSTKRAYHHGTMLIDSKLSNLRGVLGTSKVCPGQFASVRAH